MAQFGHYTRFKFDGFYSDMLGLYIVSTDDVTNERIYGTSSSLDLNQEYKIPIFNVKKRGNISFDIEITKLDAYHNPLKITRENHDDIMYWLEKEEPRVLEIGDMVFYGCFTEYKEWSVSQQGIIRLTFQIVQANAFTSVIVHNYTVATEKYITVNNLSNLERYTYSDIEINPLADSTTGVTIWNKTTQETFTLSNLVKGQKIRIYGASQEIVNLSDTTKNVFKNYSGEFIQLRQGENELKITGNVEITFLNQFNLGMR